jgi:hypothetical protein
MPKLEFAMLAHTADVNNLYQYIGWYASRKLNGWGCIWDGGITRGKLAESIPWYYRGGDRGAIISTGLWSIGRADKYGIRPKVICAPEAWLDKLPTYVPLQGELWRNDELATIKSICGRTTNVMNEEWDKINFMVYNCKPYSSFYGRDGQFYYSQLNESFSDLKPFYNNDSWIIRMQKVASALIDQNKALDTPIHMVEQIKIKDPDHLRSLIKESKINGHEGIMLINPSSKYQCYRSDQLLKIKPEFDGECEVIGTEEGDKRHLGRLGALVCQLTWDEKILSITGGTVSMIGKRVQFKIGGGFSDDQREWSYVQSRFYQNRSLPFTFLCVSADGIPCHANYKGNL